VRPKTKLLIYLALCALAVGPVTTARADTTSDQNAEFLARAAAANKRCNVLTLLESEELSAFADAAAESKKAKSAAKRGTATGANVRCGEQAARGIRGVLKSARSQGLAKATQSTVPVVAVQQLVNLPQQSPSAEVPPEKPVQKQRALTKKPLRQAAAAGLKRYETMATTYYKELRCPSMSRSELLAFYDNVIDTHRKSVAIYGSARVSAAVRTAAARAKAGNC
jgi:hypothetical protein